jgi:hypothetical protein
MWSLMKLKNILKSSWDETNKITKYNHQEIQFLFLVFFYLFGRVYYWRSFLYIVVTQSQSSGRVFGKLNFKKKWKSKIKTIFLRVFPLFGRVNPIKCDLWSVIGKKNSGCIIKHTLLVIEASFGAVWTHYDSHKMKPRKEITQKLFKIRVK